MARVGRVDPRVLLQVVMIIQMDGVIFRRGDHGLLHQERVGSQALIQGRVASQVAITVKVGSLRADGV